MTDLAQIELAEYEEALTQLVESPVLRRIVVQNYANTRMPEPGVLRRESLNLFNYQQGQHVWASSVMRWLEVSKPAVYFQLIQEIHAYEYRRRTAGERESDDSGAEFDFAS